MIRSIFLLILFTSSLVAEAQQMTVQSCGLLPSGCTVPVSPREDLNGDITAALIIDYRSDSNLEFRGNIVGEIMREKEGYLLYLVDKTKRLYIYREDSLPIEVDFTQYQDSQRGVKAGETYLLSLMDVAISPKVYEKGSNIVVIKSDEPLSNVKVNGQEWEINGRTSKRLIPYGEYEYEITSIGHRTIKGIMEVKKTLGNTIVNVRFNDINDKK